MPEIPQENLEKMVQLTKKIPYHTLLTALGGMGMILAPLYARVTGLSDGQDVTMFLAAVVPAGVMVYGFSSARNYSHQIRAMLQSYLTPAPTPPPEEKVGPKEPPTCCGPASLAQ